MFAVETADVQLAGTACTTFQGALAQSRKVFARRGFTHVVFTQCSAEPHACSCTHVARMCVLMCTLAAGQLFAMIGRGDTLMLHNYNPRYPGSHDMLSIVLSCETAVPCHEGTLRLLVKASV